jgi:hypothetical protein
MASDASAFWQNEPNFYRRLSDRPDVNDMA